MPVSTLELIGIAQDQLHTLRHLSTVEGLLVAYALAPLVLRKVEEAQWEFLGAMAREEIAEAFRSAAARDVLP